MLVLEGREELDEEQCGFSVSDLDRTASILGFFGGQRMCL